MLRGPHPERRVRGAGERGAVGRRPQTDGQLREDGHWIDAVQVVEGGVE